ncbi:MAG: hypothetical protein WA125_09140 [Desulfosporosinus sp.]
MIANPLAGKTQAQERFSCFQNNFLHLPARNFALTKANLSDGVARQTRLKRYLHQRGGAQDVFRRHCAKDGAFGGNPAFPHQTAWALVWPTTS